MSESAKTICIAEEIHYLVQLICSSNNNVRCSQLQHLIRSNHVTATPQIVNTAEQVVEEFLVPSGMSWIVTFVAIRSDADVADYPAANQELRSDSDLSPAVGAIVGNIQQVAQWRENGHNKTPLCPRTALINASYILVFDSGTTAQLLVSAGVAAQRVELITKIHGYLVPSSVGVLFKPFQTQFMVESL